MSNLSAQDCKELSTVIDKVVERKRKGEPASAEILLSQGKAKVYHMGETNPVVRVDFRFTTTQEEEA